MKRKIEIDSPSICDECRAQSFAGQQSLAIHSSRAQCNRKELHQRMMPVNTRNPSTDDDNQRVTPING
jgi:hypothetical protein